MKLTKKVAGIVIASLIAVSGSAVGVSAAVNYANTQQGSVAVNLDKDGNVVGKSGNIVMTKDDFAKNQSGSISVGANSNSGDTKTGSNVNLIVEDVTVTIEKDQIHSGSIGTNTVTGFTKLQTDSSGNVVDNDGNIIITKDQLDKDSGGSITVSGIK